MRGLGIIGLALLAALWAAAQEHWLGWAFPVHMLRHMTLVAVVSPLLVLGFPGLAERIAFPPIAGAALEFVAVWAWHLPGMHGLAYTSPAGFALEQASFLVAGLLVWAGALRAEHPLAGAGALLLTSMHMTLLGALLILAPRDLYAAICGLTPNLTAQQFGGLLMLAIGTPIYLIGGLWLVARSLRGHEETVP
ncbi:MAG: cytochrome c oxidase assembly protein [Paracoccaceae bacterium]